MVISSGAVTRPKSIGFKITNVFGRIMDYKIAGETALREQVRAVQVAKVYPVVSCITHLTKIRTMSEGSGI